MKTHKNLAPGSIAISKLSKINLKRLIKQKGYMKKTANKFGLSQSVTNKHMKRRMDKLRIYVPDPVKHINVQYPKQPFSTNENDYGKRNYSRKLENSPILPVHNEMTEVVEYYKLAIMPNF